jgi:hypothetical protein
MQHSYAYDVKHSSDHYEVNVIIQMLRWTMSIFWYLYIDLNKIRYMATRVCVFYAFSGA